MIVLLIEDHDRLAHFVSKGLEAAAFTVDCVQQGQEGLEALGHNHYDAVILDLSLPDMDGLEILRTLRERGDDIPVLVLTSRIQVADRVNGLNAGADDYLTKPFALDELTARLRALLRRPDKNLGELLCAGNLSLNQESREVRVEDRAVPISKREAALLEVLLRNFDTVIPKTDLEASLFGRSEGVSASTIDVMVHRLRKKLDQSGATINIRTFRGVGYMLTAAAHSAAEPRGA